MAVPARRAASRPRGPESRTRVRGAQRGRRVHRAGAGPVAGCRGARAGVAFDGKLVGAERRHRRHARRPGRRVAPGVGLSGDGVSAADIHSGTDFSDAAPTPSPSTGRSLLKSGTPRPVTLLTMNTSAPIASHTMPPILASGSALNNT